MTLASLIPLVLKASIALMVFSLGLQATVEDLLFLRRTPALLLRSLLAMNVIMPGLAVMLVVFFDLLLPVKVTLVALALSPVPPLLPKKELKAGGHASYAIGLLATAGLFSIVLIPLAVEILDRVFTAPLHQPPGKVAQVVLITVFTPLSIGMIVKHVAPAFAERLARPLSLAATASLAAAVIPLLFSTWPAIISLAGSGTLAALLVFIIVGLAAGHLLGGPVPSDRTVLALSTAARHPGVALAIASANFPEQKLVLPAVLLYLIAGTILSIPYLQWRRRNAALDKPPIGPTSNGMP